MLARWSLLSFFLALGGAAVAGDVADPAATPSSNAKDGGLSYETAPGESKPPLVNVNGRRVSVDEACQYYAGSDAVRQYTQMRDTRGFNANRQIELARWCRDHDLPESAEFHFRLALQLNPRGKEARKALGLREFRGMLLTDQQIAEVKADSERRAEAARRWRPKLAAIKKKFQSRSPAAQQAALEELELIDDESALIAVEEIVCPANLPAALASIRLIAGFDSQAATEALVRQAVLNPYPQARKAIAQALKTRSYFRFVPLLLGLMQSTVEVHAQLSQSLDPSFALTIFRHGPFADQLVGVNQQTHLVPRQQTATQSIVVSRPDQLQKDPIYLGESGFKVAPHPRLDEARVSAAAQWMVAAEQHNQQATLINERIGDTLAQVTGQPADTDPGVWYRWWYDYNDYPYPPEQPLFTDIARYTNTDTATNTSTYGQTVLPARPHSCFCPGTPVVTWTGLKPIETIRMGELVLSQDAETGQLAFKPVVSTTVGPPTLMLKLTAGDLNLHLTRGHPLWVIGRGWQMAKEIKPGDKLYTLGGPLTVDAVGEWAHITTHNLIVADFSDYFVTDRRILAHDITLRAPTENVEPGIPPAKVAAR